MKDIKIIDCTIRDGGYYNSWDFSSDLVDEYLAAMVAAKVDFVELGFRTLKESDHFLGPFAYTTDAILETISIPDELDIGVMVNASELVGSGSPVENAKLLFSAKESSKVSLVRIACHYHEFERSLPVCSWLKDQGYVVGVNLMQVAERNTEELERIGKLAASYAIDVLYFADSLGSLNPEGCKRVVKALSVHWHGALGIHTHDNQGRAIQNTLHSIEEGVTWVDSTVTGMGRGPGNAQTEYLLLDVDRELEEPARLEPLFELVQSRFKPMKERYGWGANVYYFLAGQHGIHPSFVQEMLGDTRYTSDDILAVIRALSGANGHKYSPERLEAARHLYSKEPTGTWYPAKHIGGRDVMILANGPNLEKHRAAVETFITKAQPYVIGLNADHYIDETLVNLRVASHPTKVLSEIRRYRDIDSPLAVPLSTFVSGVPAELHKLEIFDYGVKVASGVFEAGDATATIPCALAFAYALAIANSGKASRIWLAGFDGYPLGDSRLQEVHELLSAYANCVGAAKLSSVTPTRYPINIQSIYSL